MERVHPGNTTYTADNHWNSTKPRHGSSVTTEDAQNMKQTFIKENTGESPWNGQ